MKHILPSTFFGINLSLKLPRLLNIFNKQHSRPLCLFAVMSPPPNPQPDHPDQRCMRSWPPPRPPTPRPALSKREQTPLLRRWICKKKHTHHSPLLSHFKSSKPSQSSSPLTLPPHLISSLPTLSNSWSPTPISLKPRVAK